uniref:C2 domain-containing protein At1g53590-like n=1 Tax=Ananas comosus var. bracteatus TaxID=296719 RepID=A0A6V7QHG5_ANACO|nr:unnamed protein product [Ananas comosus var. bracteatus]
MDIIEISIVHHIGIVLTALWIAVRLGWSHPLLFFMAFVYLCKVNERYIMKLRRRLQYEERRSASQRRLLSDAETVRWLNYAVKKIWPICMEQLASQQFLLPIIPWFLDKFKPWTARKAVMQHLYLGRNPPMFTGIRVIGESTDDDHLVLELGINFASAEDMSAILAVQLHQMIGFGMTTNLHITGMHVEGKVLVGVKFLQHWPFLGRLRICFVEPPYFQMTIKPVFSYGLDVSELPGISGWLDKLLDIAFGQTLVEPNMLVIDVEKFASAPSEGWFTIDEKPSVAYVKVEILEGADMKPSDLNGLADPYVKGQLGQCTFQTKIQQKTLAPKWMEEFKLPISSWEAPNVLALQVRDKDPIFDDMLGDCFININELRGGQRHEKWLPLKNIKMGRIRLAITVIEDELEKGKNDLSEDQEITKMTETLTPPSSSIAQDDDKDEHLEEHKKVADEYEPINIEGQEKVGVWVHRPGSNVSQTWESRKGRAHHREIQVNSEDNELKESPSSSPLATRDISSPISDTKEKVEGGKRSHQQGHTNKGLGGFFGSVFQPSPRKEKPREGVWEKRTSVKLEVDEVSISSASGNVLESEYIQGKDEGESTGEKNMSSNVKNNNSRSMKSVISKKGSRKVKEEQPSGNAQRDDSHGSSLSNDAM